MICGIFHQECANGYGIAGGGRRFKTSFEPKPGGGAAAGGDKVAAQTNDHDDGTGGGRGARNAVHPSLDTTNTKALGGGTQERQPATRASDCGGVSHG